MVTPPDTHLVWSRLLEDAELSLIDIFGHDLQNRLKGAVVPVGAGRASLGTLQPGYRPRLQITDGKLRCVLTDPDLGELNLSVTDIRFHKRQDGWALDEEAAHITANHLATGRTVLLSVGLGRPWPESDPAHWLQVNNIHLEPETR